ncbi:MAG: hypothetical protein HQM12_03675 [SAR324 cluster bacterium]|nr:hypothetical protein [SAR324 cluster bacterium]
MDNIFHADHLFPYAIPPFLTMVTAFFLASITIQAGREKRANQLFTLYCLLQGLLYLDVIMETLWTSKVAALTFGRVIFMFYVFIVPVGVHFVHTILGIKRHLRITRGFYAFSAIFLLIVPTSYFFSDYRDVFYGKVPIPGMGFHLFSLYALGSIIYNAIILWKGFRQTTDSEKKQKIRYVTSGILLNAFLTLFNILPLLDIELYPLGNFGFIPLALMGYGILQHQFLDTTKSWFSQTAFTRLVVGLIWAPLALSFVFWFFAPAEMFRSNGYEHFLHHSIPPLLTVLTCYGLATFCFTSGGAKLENLLFGLICWLWGGVAIELLFTGNVLDQNIALWITRIDHFHLVNQLAVSLHLIYRIVHRPQRKLIYFYYAFGVCLMFLTHTSHYYQDTMYLYSWGLFPKANWAILVYGVFSAVAMIWAFWLLFRKMRHEQDAFQKKQILFIFIGVVLTATLNIGMVPATLGIDFYPLGGFSFIAIAITAYGIFYHDALKLNPYTKKRLVRNIYRGTIFVGYLLMIPVSLWALQGLTGEHILSRIWPYGIPPLLSLLVCIFLSKILLGMASHNQKEIYVFNLLCLSYAFLNMDILLNGLVTDASIGLRLNRWDHFQLAFLGGFSIHLLYRITRYEKLRWLIPTCYGFGLIMAPLTQTTFYLQDEMYTYYWGFFGKKAVLFDVMSLFWMTVIVYTCLVYFRYYQKSRDAFEKHRLFYMFNGFLIIGLLSLGNIPALNGYEIYPLCNFIFIPMLFLAYGMLIHNVKELTQLVRSTLYRAGLAGFTILLTGIFWQVDLFTENFQGYLLGFIFGVLCLLAFAKSWNIILRLFFIEEKESLQKAFNFMMELFSQATRFRELYQFVSYSLFRTLSSSRCILLIQHAPDQDFEGWSYQSMQDTFFEKAHPIENSELPVSLKLENQVIQWFNTLGRGASHEEMIEWALLNDVSFEPENALVSAEWIQPVFFENRLKGLVLLHEKTNNSAYTHEEKEFLFQLGMALGSYIQSLELLQGLETKVQERTSEINHINQVIQAVNSTLELQEIILTIMGFLQEVFDFNQLGIFMAEPSGRELLLIEYFGEDINKENLNLVKNVSLPLKSNISYVCETFLNNSPYYFSPVTEELVQYFFPADKQIYDANHVHSYLLFPLLRQNQPVGTIVFANSKKAFQLVESDMEQIQRYVAQVSSALNNAHLSEETHKALLKTQIKEQEITHINQVVQTVNSTLDLSQVMQSVMDALKQVFPFDHIAIMLVDEATQTMRFEKIYGTSSDELVLKLKQLTFPLENINSFYVKTVVYNDLNYIPQITPELSKLFCEIDKYAYDINPITAILMYPLEVQEHVIGTIAFAKYHDFFDLEEDTIYKIQRYVAQVATAIHNARVHDELKTTRVQLAESEKIAAMTLTFEKFVPQQFLSRIAREGLEKIELGKAESAFITILFSDIRSFTTLSETMPPQELMNFLNAYLKRMAKPIHAQKGYIDKFIGDAIMALFDLPDETHSEEALRSVTAAIDMHKVLQRYNRHRQKVGYAPIEIGIGIHSGPVVIGTVGSSDRMDSTVLGDTVNLASRLESLTKQYGVNILISNETFELIPDKENFLVREIDWVKVKGKKEPVGIYEVFDHVPKEIQELKRRSGKLIKKGLVRRMFRQWDASIEAFREALQVYPEDKTPKIHIERCLLLQNADLPENWDGAVSLDSK